MSAPGACQRPDRAATCNASPAAAPIAMKKRIPSATPLLGLLALLTGAIFSSAAAAEWISNSAGGSGAEPAISGTGRYVVFSSRARLLPADTNTRGDVYLKDRKTGALRLLSDDRGGDHPTISANGRFALFRNLEAIPKLRLLDLQGGDDHRIASHAYQNGSGTSFRWVTSGVLSPEGKFAGYPFFPTPLFTASQTPRLCLNALTDPSPIDAVTAVPSEFFFQHLGRAAMDRTGTFFFVETNDAIDSFDTNGTQDIYRVQVGSTASVRLSAPEAGLPDAAKGAHHPAVSADGSTVFFISERRLRNSDVDGRATIYRSSSANGFAVPVAIPTSVTPLVLSPQATGDGKFLAFLGQAQGEAPRPFLLRLSDGTLAALAQDAPNPGGAPSISADNSTIAFATSVALDGADSNGAADVYTVPNPFAGATITKPVVTLAGVNDGDQLTTASTLNLSATATDALGVFSTAIEVDGTEIASASGGSAAKSSSLTLGTHRIRAVCLNAANVPATSATATVLVLPAPGNLTITDVRALTRQTRGDGTTDFSATLRLDNTFASASGTLRVLLTERPAPGAWEFFGDTSLVPAEAERVLDFIEPGPLAAGGTLSLPVKSTVSPTTVVGDRFQGMGRIIVAQLREFSGGTWVTRQEVTLFSLAPVLDGDTAGPNGGVPIIGLDPNAPAFNPATLQDITINAPQKLVEGARTTLTATLVFSNTSQPCQPRWEITSGAQFATLSAFGVLTANGLTTDQSVTVKATFGSKSKSRTIALKPIAPILSAFASVPLALESGQPGEFKIVRSPADPSPLTVNYTVSGDAVPGQDYTALSGTAVISAGATTVKVPLAPLNNLLQDGRRKVVLTLQPDPKFRLSSARSATVKIEDDEAPRPDATIKAKGATKIFGLFEYNDDSTLQSAPVRGALNQASVFIVACVNRTATDQAFTITGGSDFLGFKVRYFDGDTDVTAAVTGAGLSVPVVLPAAQVALELRITPTSDTPLDGFIQCPVILDAGGFTDAVQATVRRSR